MKTRLHYAAISNICAVSAVAPTFFDSIQKHGLGPTGGVDSAVCIKSIFIYIGSLGAGEAGARYHG